MDFNSADERDDATVAKTQNERLAPPVINRKIPSPPHCKMLQAPTLARHVASQIESEERMNLRVSAEEIDPGTSPAELASEKANHWGREGILITDGNGQQHIETPWLHSDIKNMAYYYVYPAFTNIVEKGEME